MTADIAAGELKVGFLGTGIMGTGIIHNLLSKYGTVRVWNRSSANAEAVLKAGALWSESPRALSNACDLVLICVTNQEASLQCIAGEGGILSAEQPAHFIVEHSTLSPEHVQRMAVLAEKHGCFYMDGPVSGGDVGAREGTLACMLGGPDSACAAVLPVLNSYCKKIMQTGPVGSGQATKAVNQTIVALTTLAMTEGLVLAKKYGLNMETTLALLTSGAANSWTLEKLGPRVLADNFQPGFFARDMLKDLRIVGELCKALDLNLPGTDLAQQLYDRLCAKGLGDLGTQGLIKLY